ncbi:MAG TPA: hypothetical protein QGF95_26825 [Candidatus Latescibacteria bacterium]|jgi:hypothetical protein|nr:hypothetical protein [Candidatus Latescibacterota bacterium]HJP34178.1 hypothetical protein [Candidatus Latescibacterota bacterium]
MADSHHDFSWQGVRLRVPEEWELGRVDGDADSGYARLDDARMVRAEVEWRAAPVRGARRPVSDLVDRYIEQLQKKAGKSGMDFTVQRQARFLRDKRWLEGSEYETFIWEADYRAYNLARACPDCHRIILLRVLAPVGENAEALVNEVLPSLEDHPREADHEHTFWSVYGMRFKTPPDFTLSDHQLKSGHIRLTFEKDRGARVLRIHRLSMAQMLLRDQELADWFPSFFHKDLRDFKHVVSGRGEDGHVIHGHDCARIHGQPRSRWRQILRPLPLVNPRPRRHLEGAVWHCPDQNRICVVEHLSKKRPEGGDDFLEKLIDGYVCHTEQAAVDARSDDGLAPGAQRPAGVGEDGDR